MMSKTSRFRVREAEPLIHCDRSEDEDEEDEDASEVRKKMMEVLNAAKKD